MIKVGLCLSGGGARGAAHLGVIKALEENGIKVHAISGASAGALVGALYAAGTSQERILQFLNEGSLFKTIKFGIPDRGLGDLGFLKKLLPKYIDKSSFEELDKKLYVTATNLMKGKVKVFDSGEMILPIMASCAIPLVFSPINIDGEIYVDGGTLDNMPVSPLLEECDYIIGVNLLPQLEVGQKSLNSFMGILGRVFDLGILANTAPNFAKCNVLISPMKLHKYSIFSFSKAEEKVKIGYESTMHAMDTILTELEHMETATAN